MQVLLSHPGNPQFAQQAARALYEAKLLAAYVTTFHYRPQSGLGRLLKTGMGLLTSDPERQLNRRRISEVPDEVIVGHPRYELLRTLALKAPTGPVFADLVWEQAELWFDRTVARQHLGGVPAVFGYEHAALQTFQAQRRQGGLCIYEMPISHHKLAAELLQPEFDRFPETRTAYDVHLQRLAPRRNWRKDEELALADLVLAPSAFVKNSLIYAGVAPEKVAVIPYGAPPPLNEVPERQYRPCIFLSAGSQSVRKGIHYLLQAWRKLAPGPEAELWLVGAMNLPERLLRDLPGKVLIKPSVPRQELFEIYRQAAVLVLPSLCEGYALVIGEALAHGLPVITTANSGGEAFIENGVNSFMLPVRDVDRLAETMQWCIDNPASLPSIAAAALRTARNWQWQDYRRGLRQQLDHFLSYT